MNLKLESDNKKDYILDISNKNGTVFQIKENGTIKYTNKGKLIIVKNKKTLGIAMGRALDLLVRMNQKEINKQKNNR